jgi:tetratricopeptide (TPR) repeat protein
MADRRDVIMVVHSQFGSASFRLVAKGLVAFQRLTFEGRDDTPEAESIRDALDAPLKALNRIEKERAQWLSEDLYSVGESPSSSSQKQMNPQAQQQLTEALEARQSREWDRALELLRRWREHISPTLLSYLRGSVWLESGIPEVAGVFFKHASEGDPANGNYKAIYMHTLAEFDSDAAVSLARDVLVDDQKHAPVVVAQAANICFNETRTASDAEAAQLCRELIPVLQKNATRLEKDEEAVCRSSAYAMTVGLLGVCHEFLGNAGAAVNVYTRGLQADPDNDKLLVARGILQYGTSPHAISDFEQAVSLDSRVVWPYLFLAHQYLLTQRFEECRVVCESGLRMRGSDTAKSQLEEWRAIAQAELGFPPELVRSAFEAALRLDPGNELARRNQETFEASLKTPRTSPGLQWEKKSEASLRQFGLSERRYPLAA